VLGGGGAAAAAETGGDGAVANLLGLGRFVD
jgi:hypothetical protein